MGLLSSIGGAIGSIGKAVAPFSDIITGAIGSYGAYAGAEKSADASLASAREQMAFQKHMSSTAHVREVHDLKKAGLNPIISAHGGASTPSGAGYEYPNVNVAGAGIEAMGSSAVRRKVNEERKNTVQTRKNLEQMEDNIKAQTRLYTQNSALGLMQEWKAFQEANNVIKQGKVLDADVRKAELDTSILNSEYAKWLRLQDMIFNQGNVSAFFKGLGPAGTGIKDAYDYTFDQRTGRIKKRRPHKGKPSKGLIGGSNRSTSKGGQMGRKRR